MTIDFSSLEKKIEIKDKKKKKEIENSNLTEKHRWKCLVVDIPVQQGDYSTKLVVLGLDGPYGPHGNPELSLRRLGEKGCHVRHSVSTPVSSEVLKID